MAMDIVLLPRDGSRINSPLSPEHTAALDVVATTFNGGRNHDGRGYQMQMTDGGLVDLSDDTEYSAGIATLRYWDEQRADFIFQVMTATDRVAVLINQSPAIVLSHSDEVSLDDAGYERGCFVLRIVNSAADVLKEAEPSFESWSAYRDQVLAASATPEIVPPPASAKRGLASFLTGLLKGGRT